MDCKEAENLYEFYVLGALDSEDRSLMDSHLETCDACSERLQQDGETLTLLAYAVPQLEAPARVKQRLLSRVDADLRSGERVGFGRRLAGLWRGIGRPVVAYPGATVAVVLLLGLVFGGVWFDSRISRLSGRLEAESKQSDELRGRIEAGSKKSDELTGRIEAMVEREADFTEMVTVQRDLAYEAMRFNTQSVSLLRGQGRAWNARGMMMMSPSEPRAVLLAVNLPPLPDDKAYQVWLISDGRMYDGGLFRVDSTGFGKAVILPVIPFSEIDALGITVEPAGGSHGPTGVNVLKGDL